MKGRLFDNAPFLDILPEAIEVGGSWEGHPQTDPALANDADLIEMVYDYLKPIENPILIDVGASTGSFSLLPALLPSLTVFSVEPNRSVFNLLERHLQMNHLRHRVQPSCAAAWHRAEQLTLSIPSDHATGCASVGKPDGYTPIAQYSVEGFTLDKWLDDTVPQVNLIKIDVEGAEKFALEGAAKLIERYRPVLLIECTWTTGLLFGYDRQEILTLIESWGYSYTWAKEDNAWCVPN